MKCGWTKCVCTICCYYPRRSFFMRRLLTELLLALKLAMVGRPPCLPSVRAPARSAERGPDCILRRHATAGPSAPCLAMHHTHTQSANWNPAGLPQSSAEMEPPGCVSGQIHCAVTAQKCTASERNLRNQDKWPPSTAEQTAPRRLTACTRLCHGVGPLLVALGAQQARSRAFEAGQP